jgi:hypothetical protein
VFRFERKITFAQILATLATLINSLANQNEAPNPSTIIRRLASNYFRIAKEQNKPVVA